mgnify:CR=1 FL=1
MTVMKSRSTDATGGAVGRDRPLRVCYFGTYRAGYTRNQIILKGLQTLSLIHISEPTRPY